MCIHTTTLEKPGQKKSDLVFVASAVSSKMLRSIAKKEGMVFEVESVFCLSGVYKKFSANENIYS
jgi:hypothetical protein